MEKTMKVIAMYLPQYHEVRENNEWWGAGFTDWISAKDAIPLFEGHYQPRVPKNGFYYDLMNKETMKWQADLMNQYSVDGLCMYHYWFKNGRKILERPAENLLKWKDINMPFCFCWANETWARSWSNIKKKNIWTNKNETHICQDETGVLLEQEYGNEDDWREHLEYLIPFFEDSRYITVENKPLFLIYQSADIKCIDEMLSYWKEKIIDYGFDGIYIIGAHCDFLAGESVDAELCEEPPGGMEPFFRKDESDGVFCVDYVDVWESILREGGTANKTYFGGFVGYDDTPRRGKEGFVVRNATPELFGSYLAKLMAKNEVYDSDIVFINAWNEWGEGMYLEPDERYGTKFLEAIPYAKSMYKEFINDYKRNHKNKLVSSLRMGKEKFHKYFRIMDKWMTLLENKECVSDKLVKMGLRSILVYGYGTLGFHLLHELEGSDVSVLGVIDKRRNVFLNGVEFYTPDAKLPECDAIIVTASYFMNDICKTLGKDYRLIAIEDIIEC